LTNTQDGKSASKGFLIKPKSRSPVITKTHRDNSNSRLERTLPILKGIQDINLKS